MAAGLRGALLHMISRKQLIRAGAALAGVAALTAAIVGPAWAADRHVKIVNKTGVMMNEFYASRVGAKSWEEDILGADVLASGQSVNINIDDGTGACRFDFKAVFDDGDVVIRENIDVCKVGTYTYE